MKTRHGLYALLALIFCAAGAASSHGAALVTTNVVGSGSSWNNSIWKTNLTDTVFVGTPVGGNTYTVLSNGVGFGNNTGNARLRNPVVVGGPPPVFTGDSLTLNAQTELRFKTNTIPFTCIFPGTNGNPGLIMNGGALNAGDDALFIISGRVSVASASILSPANNGLADWKTGRGFRLGASLEGPGPLIILQAATNIPAAEVTSSNNNFPGGWIVKAGFLKGTAPGSLGSGNILLSPAYTVPTTLYASGTALSNGPVRFEVNYDMISTGALTMTSGSIFYLHQNIRVGSLSINGTNVALGTYPYATLTNMFPTSFSPNGSGSIAVGPPPPVITVNTPVDGATFFPTVVGMSFTITSTTPLFTNNIKLTLNGVDVSSGLVVSGSDLNANVSYASLAPNTVYTATITASNASAAATTTFMFDTLTAAGVVQVQAEDYDFGDGDCSLVTEPIDGGGGLYLNNPAPGAYSNFIAGIDIDYHDTAVTRSSPVTNAYRQCDYVGTTPSADAIHQPFVQGGFPDFDVWQIQTGEWLNYTRDYPAGNYLVYLRAVSSANNTFRLDKVVSGGGTTSQTTAFLGMFNVPSLAGAYRYRPLTDAFGNNAIIHLSGSATTLRLTALVATNNVQVNSLVLVPVAGTRPPSLATASPAPGATGILPDAVITASVAAGDTAANAGTMVVRLNGTDVTAGATITTVGDSVNVTYDPPGFLATNTAYTVSLEYADTAAVSFTNTWTFNTISTLPILPLDFATSTGSGGLPGFNIKIRKGPNTASLATFTTNIARAELHLADQIINPATGQPWVNDAAPGVTNVSLINFEQAGGLVAVAGSFTSSNGYPDSTFPFVPAGDPRWTNDPNFISMEATFYLPLPVGVHRLGVRSDDGFRLTAGATPGSNALVLMQYDAGRGDTSSEVDVQVGTAGLYAFRLVYFEGTGGASLELYSVNRSTGVRTLINDVAAGGIPAYRTRTQEPPSAPPLIVNVSPANNTFSFGGNTFSFETLASTGNTISPSAIQVLLNGTDISGSLTIGGTPGDRTVSYNGIQPNQPYRAVITVTDGAGHSTTQTVGFDTFDYSQALAIEAEDYNYAQSSCPVATTTGGLYDAFAAVDGYLGFAGINGIDFMDLGNTTANSAYRPCDNMGTQVSPDAPRPSYVSTNDYQVWRLLPGEWLNYTRIFDVTPATYTAYVRVSSSAARKLTLSRVVGSAENAGQTADLIGTFNVPNTGGAASFVYVPLTDALGNPASMSLDSASENPTLRLASLTASNDVQVNFILLVPVGGVSRPTIASLSPAPGAVKVQPGTPITVQIANSTTAANTNMLALVVNGVNVTSSSTIAGDAYLTTISYTPPTLWPQGSVQTVQVMFNDNGAPSVIVSNQWSFTVASGVIGPVIHVNFAATNAPTFAGYLQDTGSVFAARADGYSYGWDRDIQADGRYRTNINSPDLRYDTFNHMQKILPSAVWEIAVPNGTYQVHIVAGDPTAVDSQFQFLLENTVNTPAYVPVSGAWWGELDSEVTVTDGRLTVTSGIIATNNKINFIDITPAVVAVAPTITRAPTNRTVNLGQSATFSVTVRGTEILTYQWLHDSAPIAGANGASYTVSSATLGDAGAYSVIVSNSAGTATSAAATLTVNDTGPSEVRIAIERNGTNVVISWPDSATGWVLKESPTIPTNTWATTTNTVINANGAYRVTIPGTNGNKFFRLEH